MELPVATIAAALALASQSGMSADGSGATVRALGEALAFQKACPAMVLDRDFVAATLARAGIRIAPVMPRIKLAQPYHQLALSNLDVVTACILARRYYGSAGTRAAGYLVER